MKEKWEQIKKQLITFWSNSSKRQKTMYIGVAGLLLIMIVVITVLTSTNKFEPLYTDLSVQEAGQIAEELESRSIPFELEEAGTAIHVPEDQRERLLVDLAAQGIPHSGNIDYSFFSENASWGVTDNEFNIMKLDAMQTELANLMKGIEGVEDANIMITLPQESVFVNEEGEEASASIVLHTSLGHEFQDKQIDSLYHLVSRAVPNLPAENVVITNQYFEYFDRSSATASDMEGDYTQQQAIKKDVERDIQKRLQQMLGTMVGMDRVVVSVTADVDFTNENRIEELVEPVDVDAIEGIPVSIETIRETFEGDQIQGGEVGTGEGDVPNYPAVDGGQDGDYELAKDTVNYEMNRINREIAESPYKIRDLGIQVVVDNVQGQDGDEVQLLSQQEQNTVEEGIASILNSMISTSIDKEYDEVEPEENVSIVFQTFNGRDAIQPDTPSSIPMWVYIVGAVLLLMIILLLVLYLRNRNQGEPTEVIEEITRDQAMVEDITDQPKSEKDVQLDQLEKMAKDQPEDFAKLLRSWISED